MIPCTLSIRLATRPSRIERRIGIPPATLASNATSTPRRAAAPKISAPCSASSALFAVTTCLPASIERRISRRAEALCAVQPKQPLVRGDDVLAGVDRAQDQPPRGVVAADQLDHDRDLGI